MLLHLDLVGAKGLLDSVPSDVTAVTKQKLVLTPKKAKHYFVNYFSMTSNLQVWLEVEECPELEAE